MTKSYQMVNEEVENDELKHYHIGLDFYMYLPVTDIHDDNLYSKHVIRDLDTIVAKLNIYIKLNNSKQKVNRLVNEYIIFFIQHEI